MNNIAIFDPANYPAVLPAQGFIYSYQPPGMVRVRGNIQGDTLILDSSQDRWEVRYGGSMKTIDWNHVDLLDINKSLIALWRHHLTEVIQTKSPPTIFQKFQSFRNFAHEISADISLVSLLAIFSRLFAQNRSLDFYYLRVFYNWGVSHGIEIFDRRVQSIINDLPAPKRNYYESIFLQQNYITSAQEVQFLKYIDLRLSTVEHISTQEFDVHSYRALRDATLLLLIYEVAPRPLQVHMLGQSDMKEINVDGDSFFSIRFRRNKNRHLSEEYTSFREISVRLGMAMHKLAQLNHSLLSLPNVSDTQFFASTRGSRWNVQVISLTVCKALEAVFGIEKLDVEGALTPFRHHLGQALADQGAPPSVIADRLGHSTEVAARAYITATPSIAKIKTRALGENETYLYLMKALMTGAIMRREELNDASSIVRGTVGMHYIEGIGACDVNGNCHSNPVFACYTCRKFHPFVDGPHDRVIDALQEQAINFMATTIDLQHSRPITQLEIAIESAKAVLRECKKHEV